jgi:spore coat protein U-like protein
MTQTRHCCTNQRPYEANHISIEPVGAWSVLTAALLMAVAAPAAGNSCTVSATSLALGSYAPGTGAVASTATVTITCNAGTLFAVGASGGNSGNENQRLLTSGANSLQYNLYTSASYATIWGDGSGTTAVFSGTATASPSVFHYFGLLPDNAFNQGAVAGSYSDSILVVVSF